MIETIDPTTGTVLERIPLMDAAADRREARRGGASASRLGRDVVRRARRLAARRRGAASRERDALAATAVREMGKPLVQARAEVEKCAWALRVFCRARRGDARAAAGGIVGARAVTSRFGRWASLLAIMPWNFPYWQVVRAAAPALMAGNALAAQARGEHDALRARDRARLQRSRRARRPASARCSRAAKEIGTIVARSAHRRGDAHRKRSAPASRWRARRANALKKCVLELGGSDAFVVLRRRRSRGGRAKTAVTARFQNNGESCIAAKRFIVEEPVYDEFLARFVELAARADRRQSDGRARRSSARARARIFARTFTSRSRAHASSRARASQLGGKSHRRRAASSTSRPSSRTSCRACDVRRRGLRTGGRRHSRERPRARARACQRFALRFGLEHLDARRRARPKQLAARVEAGAVFINGMVASDPRLPFGGVKKSGYGRELSAFGIHEFVNIQTVWIGREHERHRRVKRVGITRVSKDALDKVADTVSTSDDVAMHARSAASLDCRLEKSKRETLGDELTPRRSWLGA